MSTICSGPTSIDFTQANQSQVQQPFTQLVTRKFNFFTSYLQCILYTSVICRTCKCQFSITTKTPFNNSCPTRSVDVRSFTVHTSTTIIGSVSLVLPTLTNVSDTPGFRSPRGLRHPRQIQSEQPLNEE